MNENTIIKHIITVIGAIVLGGYGYNYLNNRKHEAYMLKLPAEYFTAEAEKAKAEADRNAREYEARKAEELERYKAKLEFEKNASPEYWAYKNAQEDRDSKERISKNETEAKKAQATEMRRALEAYMK